MATSRTYLTMEKVWREYKTSRPPFGELPEYADVTALLRTYQSLEVPTRYEDKDSYRTIALFFQQVSVASERASGSLPLVATLASGTVNAVITESPDATPILFIEHGLLRFVQDFALLTAWMLPTFSMEMLTDDGALGLLSGRHTASLKASEYLVGTLFSYVVDGNVGRLPIPLPEHNQWLAFILSGQMCRFVLAHELTHLLLHHLDLKEPSPGLELDADAGALRLVSSEPVGGTSWAFNVWSCDVALTSLQLLDHALALIAFGKRPLWSSRSHPDALTRRSRLRELALGAPIGESSRQIAASLFRMNDAVFGTLGEIASGLLLALREQKNARPSPLWRNRIGSVFAAS